MLLYPVVLLLQSCSCTIRVSGAVLLTWQPLSRISTLSPTRLSPPPHPWQVTTPEMLQAEQDAKDAEAEKALAEAAEAQGGGGDSTVDAARLAAYQASLAASGDGKDPMENDVFDSDEMMVHADQPFEHSCPWSTAHPEALEHTRGPHS